MGYQYQFSHIVIVTMALNPMQLIRYDGEIVIAIAPYEHPCKMPKGEQPCRKNVPCPKGTKMPLIIWGFVNLW